MQKENKIMFDPQAFVDSLMEEMEMVNPDSDEEKKLRENIEFHMNHIILNTLSLNVEPVVIDRVSAEYKNEEDIAVFALHLIEQSPKAQYAIAEALADFRKKSLEAYHRFSRK